MRRIDWLPTAAPDPIQRGRMYDITDEDPTERRYFFDPATGDMYCQDSEDISDSGKIEWFVSLQTFPYGEVRNA